MKTNRHGFTLVELLVALAVFSGLMLTLFSSFNAFTASSKMIQDFEQQSRGLVPALSTLTSDLSQIFMLDPAQRLDPDVDEADDQKKYGFTAAREPVQGQTMSQLSFTGLSPLQFYGGLGQAAGITRISYTVLAHGERFDLHRSDIPIRFYNPSTPVESCRTPVLVRQVQAFELTFFDAKGNEYDHWDSMDEEFGYALPSRIKITLTTGSKKPFKIISTQVFLPFEREPAK